jgi:MYXO-CTERM domain-containing protein
LLQALGRHRLHQVIVKARRARARATSRSRHCGRSRLTVQQAFQFGDVYGLDEVVVAAGRTICVADADGGTTKTNPLDPDTDGGSVSDGDEDVNKDGKVDAGERDPNDGSDDIVGGEGGAGGEGAGGSMVAGSAGALVTAGDGGVMNAGSNTGGSAAANGGTATAGVAGNLGAGASDSVDGILEGGGCACRTAAPTSSQAPLTALVSILGLLGVAMARRRGRNR